MAQRKSPPLKDWSFTDGSHASDQARHRDGRHAAQVMAAVRATSLKQAVSLTQGWTIYGARQFWYSGVNDETSAVLDKVPPGTVIIHPHDAQGTVRGQRGWIRRDTGEVL